MMTEIERNFRVGSALNIAAKLFWKEIGAEVDYNLGFINRQEYERISRLHEKAERVYEQRLALPYEIDFTKDYSRKLKSA